MTSLKRVLPTILLTTAIAGCGSAARIPERVLVPVAAECPAPAIPARPLAPPALHDKLAPDADKARALAIYISNLNGHIDALTALLGGYAPIATKQ